MNITTSERYTPSPKLTSISKQAWDAKVDAARKAKEAEQSWLENKLDRYTAGRPSVDWDNRAEMARFAGLIGVGGTVGVLAGLHGGAATGLMVGGISGIVAGTLCGWGVNLMAPPATGIPEFREPLFVV